MSKQIPILFSTAMVPALLEGRKTITRRVSALGKINEHPSDWEIYGSTSSDTGFVHNARKAGDYCICFRHKETKEIVYIQVPYGKVGDVLWVRETWFNDAAWGTPKYHYRADGSFDEQFERHALKQVGPFKWKPSIHMPKGAARVWLEVVGVRVERLHEISEEDAVKEGVTKLFEHTWMDYCNPDIRVQDCARDSFMTLWYKINGPENWHANPWVWVVEFKVLSTTGKPEGLI